MSAARPVKSFWDLLGGTSRERAQLVSDHVASRPMAYVVVVNLGHNSRPYRGHVHDYPGGHVLTIGPLCGTEARAVWSAKRRHAKACARDRKPLPTWTERPYEK